MTATVAGTVTTSTANGRDDMHSDGNGYRETTGKMDWEPTDFSLPARNFCTWGLGVGACD